MDRQIVYPGQIPLETDLLKTNQNTMIAIAKLASAMFGSSTIVNGLTVTAQSPAAMAVNVSAGEIYELANLEATACSSLAADTTHSIMKQGVSLNTQALIVSAPGTVGYSINYLIQATYQDSDSNAATLPYYNSSNPSQAWSGPNNSGTQQYTTRSGAVVVSAKAGVAAATGSQVTPSPDSGYVGLYVVTVAYGASTVTSGNISQYVSAPLLPAGLLQTVQSGSSTYAVDSGVAANTYKVNLTPAITSLTDGMVIEFQPNYSNTGASTLSVNGLTAYPIVGGAHIALQGGEITATGKVQVVWHSGLSSFVILDATAGAMQVGAGSKSQHAVTLAQLQAAYGLVKTGGIAATVTLTTSNAGTLYYCTPVAGQTVTLPAPSTNGMVFSFSNRGGSAFTLATPSGNIYNYDTYATTLTVPSLATVVVYSDGTSYNVLHMSGVTQSLSDNSRSAASTAFVQSLTQNGSNTYIADTGAANAYVATLVPALPAYADGIKIRLKIANTNTGSSTLNVNGLGAKTIYGAAHVGLQGGELIATGYAEFEYSTTLGGFVLLFCTGAPEQIASGTKSQHAVSRGQVLEVSPVYTTNSFASPVSGTQYSVTASFTAPCAGYVMAIGSFVLAQAVANGSIAVSLTLNGSAGSSDSNYLPLGCQFAVAAVSSGVACSAVMAATPSSTLGQAIGCKVLMVFIPNP